MIRLKTGVLLKRAISLVEKDYHILPLDEIFIVSALLRVPMNNNLLILWQLLISILRNKQLFLEPGRRKAMKGKIIVIIGVVWFFFSPANVALPQALQLVSINSSPNALGSGARALGMGNAFIAVADDATAASWNPGGLMQLETPEVSIVLYNALRTEDYSFALNPEADGSERTNTFDINYFSAAYPFAIFEKNMIVSLNYQRLYDVTKELKFKLRTQGPGLDMTQNTHYKAEGGIKALSPAYAIQITENLSVGFALNFWLDAFGGRNGWKEQLRSQSEGILAFQPKSINFGFSNEYDNTRGFNYNLGILWNINEMVTFGAVYKSPFEAKMRHTFVSTGTQVIEDTMKLNFPLSYGMGLAFRFSDEFTIAFDTYRTEWGRYFFRAEDDSKTSPIDGRPWDKSHIKATTQAHIGAEYLFIHEKTIIPVRGGVFYDPEPSEDSTEDFYGISLGSGISIGNVIFDAAYQYRWGRDTENRGVSNTEADVDHHSFYLSATYHF